MARVASALTIKLLTSQQQRKIDFSLQHISMELEMKWVAIQLAMVRFVAAKRATNTPV